MSVTSRLLPAPGGAALRRPSLTARRRVETARSPSQTLVRRVERLGPALGIDPGTDLGTDPAHGLPAARQTAASRAGRRLPLPVDGGHSGEDGGDGRLGVRHHRDV
jgi:hypothetical protein